MFWKNVLYNIKIVIKRKYSLMWLIVFPIFLSTFFFFAFGSVSMTATYEKSDVAIVMEGENAIFMSYFNSVADSAGEDTESALFNSVEVGTRLEAEGLLATNEVHSVFVVNSNDVILLVTQFTTNETMAKSFLDNFKSNEATIKSIVANGGSVEQAIESLTISQSIIDIPISDNEVDQVATMYFALIGMICLMFAFCGADIVKFTKPSQSVQAQRVTLSSTSREKIFASSYIGMFLASMVIISLSIFHIGVVLGVNIGNIGYVLIIGISGVFAGIGLGMLISSVLKTSYETNDNIISITTLVLGFLAGLMSPDIKAMITSKVPFFNYINPVALISDAFSSLTYFNSMGEFWIRIVILWVIGSVSTIISLFNLRRNCYASV